MHISFYTVLKQRDLLEYACAGLKEYVLIVKV